MIFEEFDKENNCKKATILGQKQQSNKSVAF